MHVGLHVIPDKLDQTGLFGMVERLARAGHPVPFMTVLNDAALADTIKVISPRTIVVFRADFNDHPTAADNGGDWLDKYLPALRACKKADAYQCACEDLSNVPEVLSTFYVQMMQRAIQIGIRIVVGNIASGNPPGDIQAGIEALRPMLQMASAHAFPLDYHLYSPRTTAGFADIANLAEYYVLRYKFWRAAFPKLIIWGGEAGTGQPDYQGPKTLELMKQLDRLIDIPVAYWSCGWWSDDHGASQIDGLFSQYEAWLMGGTPPTNPPVQTDPDAGLRLLQALLPGIQDSELLDIRIQRLLQPDLLPWQEFACPPQRLRQMLTALNLPATPSAPETINYKCTANYLRVRDQASVTGKEIGHFKTGDIVQVIAGTEVSNATYHWVQIASGGWCARTEYLDNAHIVQYLIAV